MGEMEWSLHLMECYVAGDTERIGEVQSVLGVKKIVCKINYK